MIRTVSKSTVSFRKIQVDIVRARHKYYYMSNKIRPQDTNLFIFPTLLTVTFKKTYY